MVTFFMYPYSLCHILFFLYFLQNKNFISYVQEVDCKTEDTFAIHDYGNEIKQYQMVIKFFNW